MSNVKFRRVGAYSFGREEWLRLLIVTLVVALFIGWDDGTKAFQLSSWLSNYLIIAAAAFVFLCLSLLVQKMTASYFHYGIEYHLSWVSLVIGFFITSLSNGAVPFFLPGGLKYHLDRKMRVGHYMPSYKHSELFWVCAAMPVVPLLASIPFAALHVATGEIMFKQIVIVGLLMGVFALIPVPRWKSLKMMNLHGITDIKPTKLLEGGTYGYDLFDFSTWGAHTGYGILVGTCIIFVLLLYYVNVYNVILAFILGVFVFLVYKKALSMLMH